jgi:hypothetical protein
VADAISLSVGTPQSPPHTPESSWQQCVPIESERTSGIEAGSSYRESYGESVRRTNATPGKIAALIYDRKTLSTAQTTSQTPPPAHQPFFPPPRSQLPHSSPIASIQTHHLSIKIHHARKAHSSIIYFPTLTSDCHVTTRQARLRNTFPNPPRFTSRT